MSEIDSAPTEPESHPFGRALVQELIGIHSVLRRDLGVVLRLAADVAAGAPAEQARRQVRELESNSPIWQLKINCMYYCRFVHGHHTFEDNAWFPALRKADPEIDPVIDKLEDDHERISKHTEAVVIAADQLDEDASPEGRGRLTAALEQLAEQLIEHLDYEEEAISPTLRSLERWPR